MYHNHMNKENHIYTFNTNIHTVVSKRYSCKNQKGIHIYNSQKTQNKAQWRCSLMQIVVLKVKVSHLDCFLAQLSECQFDDMEVLSSQWPCVAPPNPSAVAALMYFNQAKASHSNKPSDGLKFN